MRHALLSFAIVFACLFGTPTAVLPQDAPTCAEVAGFQALDFWVGEWEVFVGETKVGTNRIEKVLDGCAVTESWIDVNGGEGRSLFYYQPVIDRWKQVWVTGAATRPGGVKEKTLIERSTGRLRFQGTIPTGDGEYLDRTTLTRQPDGTVRQHIEVQPPGGEWRTTFDAIYRPAAGATRTD